MSTKKAFNANIVSLKETGNREKILDSLRRSRDLYSSGQEIGQQLGVSRTIIWKHVKALRSQGYIIESHTRLGHKLIRIPDLLLPLEIKAQLRTKVFGQRIFHFTTIGSTQKFAFELARKGEPEGALVVAEGQTEGRGRRGNTYFCPRGGIWFSLLLRPSVPPNIAPLINLAAGVAVAEVATNQGASPILLKWPNDVLIGKKKISGILSEMSAEPDQLHFVILGIGINANISREVFPRELLPVATSMSHELDKKVDRIEILCRVLESLEKYYRQLIEKGPSPILQAWRKLPNILGRTVEVSIPEGCFEGKAMDLDDEGALIVKSEAGEIRKFVAGEVSLISTK